MGCNLSQPAGRDKRGAKGDKSGKKKKKRGGSKKQRQAEEAANNKGKRKASQEFSNAIGNPLEVQSTRVTLTGSSAALASRETAGAGGGRGYRAESLASTGKPPSMAATREGSNGGGENGPLGSTGLAKMLAIGEGASGGENSEKGGSRTASQKSSVSSKNEFHNQTTWNGTKSSTTGRKERSLDQKLNSNENLSNSRSSLASDAASISPSGRILGKKGKRRSSKHGPLKVPDRTNIPPSKLAAVRSWIDSGPIEDFIDPTDATAQRMREESLLLKEQIASTLASSSDKGSSSSEGPKNTVNGKKKKSLASSSGADSSMNNSALNSTSILTGTVSSQVASHMAPQPDALSVAPMVHPNQSGNFSDQAGISQGQSANSFNSKKSEATSSKQESPPAQFIQPQTHRP